MPVKIRLARRGRKFAKIYNIVVADGRAPRDGKYIEVLGQYNPATNPATIRLDFDRSLEWLQKGAQPTDTCRAILSYKGVMYKKHLLEGVKKGAFDEAEAERRFQSWMTAKEQKIQGKVDKLKSDEEAAKNERLAAEAKINEARELEIQKQRSELLKEAEAANAEATDSAPEADETAAEAPKEEPKAEEKKEKPKAEAKEEKKEEAKSEDVKEEAKADKKEEEPKEEPKAEEKEAPKKEAKEEQKETEEAEKKEPKAEVKDEPKADEEKKDDASEEEKK
ncbi:MAG TPA: 30S ribosomal protein S16 [Bacteroidales bacterium]|nr:30S ribosomal protein S16 [Bacteroidales bacterium]